jgi:hypothetical protein
MRSNIILQKKLVPVFVHIYTLCGTLLLFVNYKTSLDHLCLFLVFPLFFKFVIEVIFFQDPKGARHAGDLGNVLAEGGVAKVSSTFFSKPNSLSSSVADP